MFPAASNISFSALQSVRITPFREDSASKATGIFDAKAQVRKGAKGLFPLGVFAVLFPRIAHFRQSFSVSVFSVCSCSNSSVAAGRAASWRLCVRTSFLSVKSLSTVLSAILSAVGQAKVEVSTTEEALANEDAVQFLWLRLAAPGFLRGSTELTEVLFAAIQSKFLTMNNLRSKPSLSSQGQSSPVKEN